MEALTETNERLQTHLQQMSAEHPHEVDHVREMEEISQKLRKVSAELEEVKADKAAQEAQMKEQQQYLQTLQEDTRELKKENEELVQELDAQVETGQQLTIQLDQTHQFLHKRIKSAMNWRQEAEELQSEVVKQQEAISDLSERSV